MIILHCVWIVQRLHETLMDQSPLSTNYRIFLLTVWRDGGEAEGPAALRFSLHDPRSGLRQGFSEADVLLAFAKASFEELGRTLE